VAAWVITVLANQTASGQLTATVTDTETYLPYLAAAACAAAVAAARIGRTGRKVTVTLPGGDLAIDWRESDDHVLMTGPTEYEHKGHFDAALFAAADAQS
jgi:hypothetical protein